MWRAKPFGRCPFRHTRHLQGLNFIPRSALRVQVRAGRRFRRSRLAETAVSGSKMARSKLVNTIDQTLHEQISIDFCTDFCTNGQMIGQFFTPEIVAHCMFRLAGVRSGQRVIDPSCGDGVFVRNAPQSGEIFGCEIDPQYGDVVRSLLDKGNFVAGDALTGLLSHWGTFDLAKIGRAHV